MQRGRLRQAGKVQPAGQALGLQPIALPCLPALQQQTCTAAQAQLHMSKPLALLLPPPTDTCRAGSGGGKVTESGCVAATPPCAYTPPTLALPPAATASASARRCGGELADEAGSGPSRKGPRRSGVAAGREASSARRAEAERRRPAAAESDASSEPRPCVRGGSRQLACEQCRPMRRGDSAGGGGGETEASSDARPCGARRRVVYV